MFYCVEYTVNDRKGFELSPKIYNVILSSHLSVLESPATTKRVPPPTVVE